MTMPLRLWICTLLSALALLFTVPASALVDLDGSTLVVTDTSGSALGGTTLTLEITPEGGDTAVVEARTDDDGRLVLVVDGDGAAADGAVAVPRNGEVVVREPGDDEGVFLRIRDGVIRPAMRVPGNLRLSRHWSQYEGWFVGAGAGIFSYDGAARELEAEKPTAAELMFSDSSDDTASTFELSIGKATLVETTTGYWRRSGRIGYQRIGETSASTETTDPLARLFLLAGNGMRGDTFRESIEIDGHAWLAEFGFGRVLDNGVYVGGTVGVRHLDLSTFKDAQILLGGTQIDRVRKRTSFTDTGPLFGLVGGFPVGSRGFLEISLSHQEVDDDDLILLSLAYLGRIR